MRSHFVPSPPLPPDPVEFVKTAKVVLDTNALLEPYRYSLGARDAALKALEAVRDRLWMPHQVGVEFFRNHERKKSELTQAYNDALIVLEEASKGVLSGFGDGRNFQESRKLVRMHVDRLIGDLKTELRKLRDEDPAIVGEKDRVLERLTEFYDGRLGARPTPAVIRQRVDDFHEWRVPNEIPPGYEDVPKKGRTIRAAGDYLIWEEVLDYAAFSASDVLLVTNDSKKDWWEPAQGGRAEPRRELFLEFSERTGNVYHQMNFREFITTVEDAYGINVEVDVVEEIAEIEKEDARNQAAQDALDHLSSAGVQNAIKWAWVNSPDEELSPAALENLQRHMHLMQVKDTSRTGRYARLSALESAKRLRALIAEIEAGVQRDQNRDDKGSDEDSA